MNENVLDAANWKLEVQAVINDIKSHVKLAKISEALPNNNQLVFFNLTTIENNEYCIELSGNGFRIVGKKHDTTNETNLDYFETPYSLLNTISPLYNESFGNELIEKLMQLN